MLISIHLSEYLLTWLPGGDCLQSASHADQKGIKAR